MIPALENSPSCCAPNCCEQPPPDPVSTLEPLLHILEKVSLVALGALSLYTSWQLFLPFFAIGGAVGIYSYLQDKNLTQISHAAASCTQGVLEQITGIKLPPAISLVSNVAITACHIFHHGVVFVPVVAISIGAFAGKTASYYGNWLYREITSLPTPLVVNQSPA